MEMILELVLKILGTLIFFIPGILLAWLFLKKTTLSEFISYSIILSVSIFTILSFVLFKMKIFSPISLLVSGIVISVLFLFIILFRKKKIKISFDKKIFIFMLVFSFVGALWRWFFSFQTFLWGDGYQYSRNFAIDKIFLLGESSISFPDIGFYTGMLIDHAQIVAGDLALRFYSTLGFTGFFETLIILFLLSFFTYKVIYLYRQNHRLALFGAFIVGSLGSVEIWHNTFTFFGGCLAYVGLISLFIIYVSGEKSFFYLTLALGIVLGLSDYTSSLVLILASLGFIFSIFIKTIIENKNQKFSLKMKKLIQDEKIKQYLIILLVILALFFLSGDSLMDHTEATVVSAAQNVYKTSLLTFQRLEYPNMNLPLIPEVTPIPTRPYENIYKFLRISPLNWQNLFILIMGLTFLIHLLKTSKKYGKILDEDKNILVAILPAYIVGMAFALVRYEQRSFSYLLFFMILIVKIPKKLFYYFVFFSVIFFLITGYFQNIEKISFFDNSEGEVEGALWISQNIENQTILSDQRFISLLVINEYYNVTGFPDNSPFMEPIFYKTDLNTINNAFRALNVTHFATTERMRESHILMLNFPQQPMNNEEIYKNNFEIIYDNGDVRLYKIE